MAENMRQKVKTEPVETTRKKAKTKPSRPPRYSMKLLIDNNAKRVLFAEADKDCVDFILFILSLPLSTLIRLVGKQAMTGSVVNLYDSVEALDGSFLLENVTKDTLLKLPITPNYSGYNDVPGLGTKNASVEKKFLYRCRNYSSRINMLQGYVIESCGTNISDSPRAVCPSCWNFMSYKTTFKYVAEGGGNGDGFVKDEVKFMVMDDLVVKPVTSVLSSINLITELGVKNVSELEEKVIVLGIDEGVELLKASLVSKNVLTSVFFNESGN